ncbi:hypothetical protein FKP32DRAFT_1590279, partial [Trametes sanguinea]
MCTVLGTCAGVAATVIVDECRATSVVSLRFAISHNIPRTVLNSTGESIFTTMGPVVVPTVHGRYISRAALRIQHVADADVILGQDWIIGCGAALGHNYVEDAVVVPINPYYSWELSDVNDRLPSTQTVVDDEGVPSSSLGRGCRKEWPELVKICSGLSPTISSVVLSI